MRIRAQCGADIVTTPLDWVSGVRGVVRQSLARRSLWEDGALAGILRLAPGSLIQIAVTPYARRVLPHTTPREDYLTYVMSHGIAAGLVAMVALVVLQPLDVCRARMALHDDWHSSVMQCVSTTGENLGVAGLYRGLGCAVWIAVPCAETVM